MHRSIVIIIAALLTAYLSISSASAEEVEAFFNRIGNSGGAAKADLHQHFHYLYIVGGKAAAFDRTELLKELEQIKAARTRSGIEDLAIVSKTETPVPVEGARPPLFRWSLRASLSEVLPLRPIGRLLSAMTYFFAIQTENSRHCILSA